MPTRESLRTIGSRDGTRAAYRIADDVRTLRRASGLSQDRLARAAGVSRDWLAELERGSLKVLDLRRVAVVFALLGQKLVVAGYPTGSGLRDAGQLRLVGRFNARLSPAWQRLAESTMPTRGDLRAWDELLIGPVRIGVEAETRLGSLEATMRAMAAKARDSGVARMILLVADTRHNRHAVRASIGALRQTFPLDTRAVMSALAEGRDPGAHGLAVL